jgi:hypothetical protein
MKWIKASERLPGETGFYFTRTKNGKNAIFFAKDSENPFWKIFDVEWLDESPLPNDWKEVAKELPKDLEDVLGVHYEAGGVGIVYYSEEDKKWYSSTDTDRFERLITHWMPLPAPPTGEVAKENDGASDNPSHDTFVIGMNGNNVTFFKSYEFKKQRAQAMKDLDHVQDETKFSGWFISQANNWSIKNIIDEKEDWEIKIAPVTSDQLKDNNSIEQWEKKLRADCRELYLDEYQTNEIIISVGSIFDDIINKTNINL